MTTKPHTEGPTIPTYVTKPILTTSIRTADQQLRHDTNDDDIIALAADIQRRGLLQPIGVRPSNDGTHQLLWGSRRLAAHLRLGRTTITAHIYTGPNDPIRATALAENLIRRNLTLEEECDAVHLLSLEGRSPAEIADLCGTSRGWVMRRLAIPNLPTDLRDPALRGKLPLATVEALAQVADPAARAFLVQQASVSDWTVQEVRAAVAAYERGSTVDEATAAHTSQQPALATASPILYPCGACHALHQAEELIFIRICAGGCHPTPTDHTVQ